MKNLPFEAEHDSQEVKWIEPSTGEIENGIWIAESTMPGWIIVNWNGTRWLVEKKYVLSEGNPL